MTTERKPGSRGSKQVFSGAPTNEEPRFGSDPETRKPPVPKGSTKTVSPRQSFKRKPKR